MDSLTSMNPDQKPSVVQSKIKNFSNFFSKPSFSHNRGNSAYLHPFESKSPQKKTSPKKSKILAYSPTKTPKESKKM